MAGRSRPLWGWHRLDRDWADRLVADAGVCPGDLVLDIGAGTGTITDAILDAGAKVLAVELHRGRAAALRERYRSSRVIVVQADAADLRLPRRPFKVVANPPFGAVAPLLRRLLASGSRLQSGKLVVPRHMAFQWSSPAADGAKRSSANFEVTAGCTIPRKAFVPPPPRDAKLLVIRRR